MESVPRALMAAATEFAGLRVVEVDITTRQEAWRGQQQRLVVWLGTAEREHK